MVDPEGREVDVTCKFHITPRARFVDWSGEISSLSKITPWTLDSSCSFDSSNGGAIIIKEETTTTSTSNPTVVSQDHPDRNNSRANSPTAVTSTAVFTQDSSKDDAKIILQERERLQQCIKGKELYAAELTTAYSRISDILGETMSQHQAIELYQEALEIPLRIVGMSHPDGDDDDDDVENVLKYESLVTLETALQQAIQKFGPGHSIGATHYRRIATILHHQHGKLPEAIQMLQQALMIKLTTCRNKEYLDVCTAILYCFLGDLLLLSLQKNENEAVATLEMALAIFQRVLKDPADRWLRTIYRKLGDALDRQGNYETSLKMYQSALKLELAIARDLQESAIICKRIGFVLRKLGHYDFAMKFLEEAWQIKCKTQKLDGRSRFQSKLQMYQEFLSHLNHKIHGPWHPAVAMVCIRMGHLWNAHGKYTQAIEMYQQALQARFAFFGQDHLDTAVLANTLGDVLAKAGRYQEATKYYKQSLDTFSAALGPYDPWVRTTYTKLENIFMDQDKDEQALMMHKEVFRYELQESRYIATSKLFWGSDDDDFCTKLFKNMLELRATALAPEYPDAARLYNALGDLLFAQHESEEAFQMYREAHSIETRTLGMDHPDITATRNILAKILKHQENEDEAVETYHKILGIGLQAHVHDHPLIAARYHRIGNVLNNQGRYSEAMNMYQEALEIRLSKLGYDHPDTTLLYNHMGHALANQGSYLEAARMFKRALQIWKASMGEEHPMVLSIYQKMVDMLYEQRRATEAEELYKEKIDSFQSALGNTNGDSHTYR